MYASEQSFINMTMFEPGDKDLWCKVDQLDIKLVIDVGSGAAKMLPTPKITKKFP